MPFRSATLLTVLLLSLLNAKVSQEEILMQQEITEYQQKINRLNKELAELQSEMKEDQKEIQNPEHKSRNAILNEDLEKLKSEHSKIQSENRILIRSIKKIESSIAQNKRSESNLLQTVISEATTLLRFIETLPPSISQREKTALRFLLSELNSGSITASEGTERLFTILRTLERNSASSDVWSGSSPIPGGTGLFYYIRLGLFYLAVVSENGSSGYLSIKGNWKPVESDEERQQLLHASQTALGNRTPELSSVPVHFPIESKEESQ